MRDNTYYIVMEFVQGPNLEQELEERIRLTGTAFPPEVMVDDACQVLDILLYLHGQSPPLIHRDVKPANLIREYPSGRIKLVDFGLARSLTGDKKTMTQIGTLGYSPLEQLQGRPDATSDLYALGVTMHHLLTGVVPTPLSIPPIQELAPLVDSGLAQIIDKACAPKPAGRHPDAGAMLAALQKWKAERPPAGSPRLEPGRSPRDPSRAEPGRSPRDPSRAEAPPRLDPLPPPVEAATRQGFLTRLMKSEETEAAPVLANPVSVAPARAPVTRPEKARPTTLMGGAPPTRIVAREPVVPALLLPPGGPSTTARRAAVALAGLALVLAAAWLARPTAGPAAVVATAPVAVVATTEAVSTPVAAPSARATPEVVAPKPVSHLPPRPRVHASPPAPHHPRPVPRPTEAGENFSLTAQRYPSAGGHRPPPPGHTGSTTPTTTTTSVAPEIDRADLHLQVEMDNSWSLAKNTRASTSTIIFTAGTGEASDPLQSLEIKSGQVADPARRVQNSFKLKRSQWTSIDVEAMDLAVERQGYGRQELEALITRPAGGRTRYYVVRYEVRRGKWSEAKFREEALKALGQVKIE